VTRGATLRLPASVRRAIVAHARREHPRECCGLLVGGRGRVTHAIAVRNVARGDRRRRFRLDPAGHVRWQRLLRDVSPALGILGAYHSHPAGRAWPSETDVAEAHYPEWIHVIVGFDPRVHLAAFRLARGRIRPVTIAPAGS
jgi:proteasome lid subunit RPN8/RPN11